MSISQFPPPASPSPASSVRLWRPAAQRNLRNQWLKLSTCRKQWIAACSVGMSHANSLVNSYLSQTFVPLMKFGVLSDMFDIKKKALNKLYKQQSSYRDKLLSSYKEMVAGVVEMVNVSRSMRCYMKSSSGSIIQFSCSKEDSDDAGDCGGITVFSFWNICWRFEKMAEELVEMFKHEVMLKRLLMMELVSLCAEVPQPAKLSWADELYQGEFDDLSKCSLYSMEVSEPIFPILKEDNLCITSVSRTNQPTAEMLHIYLITWAAEVNNDTHRKEEILAMMSSSSGSFSGRSSSACSSTSDCQNNSFDAEELLQIGSRRMELRKEKDLLRESQPHSIELVRSLELHTKSLSETRLEDTARIRTMEKELLSCYKEIDYLRDQLIFRSKEVSYLNEHVHNLECKLAESGNLEEEVNCLREELCLSKSEHLLLLQELESKETELQCSSLSVEKLEETISSLTLESLCEIESMKLDITALEQALGDAMKIQEESIEEKEYLKRIIKEIQFQSQEAEENAKSFEKQNEDLRERIAASEKSIKEFFQSAKARFESENGQQPLNAECFFAQLRHLFPVSSEVRDCFDAIIKRLELSRNITLIDKMEGMGQQIQLHEDLVKRLKEELKQEKLKAKEEAEELTQEMAELRYKMTCLLDEERKRRVCIEQASLQRIAELEAQIKRETNKRSSTEILPLSGFFFFVIEPHSAFFFLFSLRSLIQVWITMFGLKKPLERLSKHHKPSASASKSNPFDLDDDNKKHTLKPSNKISPQPTKKNHSFNPFDDDVVDDEVEKRSFKNHFRDSGGVENQTLQELESYAVYKSEETTRTVQGCLKVAQGIRSDATRTLVMLNEQGEKITRTHHKAVDIDHDLSRGEKILGSLGGIFSRTWKPKKTRSITGPVIIRGESPKRRVNHLETREKLGLNHLPKPHSRTHEPLPESAGAYQKIEMEKAKQDDGLADLSDLLSELKNMAIDMGTEIERQNNGLDHLQDDVDELNFRVKQSNQRARRLLRK
ncbi:hypothetical protein HID58_039544 [Brassica napus]|uniref:t-SNARE coiled-coil homology domain-containing protein n=2 Tax=Brassica TaxID=3705 RepID=A0ABQ8BTB5_BRANA|nr:hypothetical protein HID58_039544 [Brassica napus]